MSTVPLGTVGKLDVYHKGFSKKNAKISGHLSGLQDNCENVKYLKNSLNLLNFSQI